MSDSQLGLRGSRRGGILAGLVLCDSPLVEEVHRLVNETRRERGLPPWDFTRPNSSTATSNKPFTYAARLAAVSSVEGLRGDILRARFSRDLNQLAAAKQIGLTVYQLSAIERGVLTPERDLILKIQFWLDLEIEDGP